MMPAPTVPSTVEYVPRNWAIPFHRSLARFLVLVLHRRAGKTVALVNHHLRAATDDGWERTRLLKLQPALTEPMLKELMRARRYGHILPSRVQAKLVAWDMLKHYASFIRGQVPNESELRVDLPGGHRVQLFGADNPDAFRGAPFSGISYDEFSQHPPNIFSEVTSKSLADHLGYAIFAGTIKGKNQLWKTYEAAKSDPTWFSLWADIQDSLANEVDGTTLMLRQAMHDDQQLIAKGLMSQEEYEQEWFLSVTAAIKGAYYAKQLIEARQAGRIRAVAHDPALRVHDVWDLGKGPNMSIGFFQRVGRQVSLIDYEEGLESDGIPQMIKKLQDKPYLYGKHLAPGDIKATDLSTGKTRWETAKALGWEFTVVPELSVMDGINAGRNMFARLWVEEEKCATWIEAMGAYQRVWFERLGMFGDDPVHNWASHPADMYRYAAVGEELMTNELPKAAKPKPPSIPTDPTVLGLSWMGH
jgi:phage terminase large subunit